MTEEIQTMLEHYLAGKRTNARYQAYLNGSHPLSRSVQEQLGLSSKETGIKFNNKLKDTKEHNILIYSNYYGGAGSYEPADLARHQPPQPQTKT